MKDTVKIMVESDFGFDTNTLQQNRGLFESAEMISEDVRQLTGYTPDKVVALDDGNNVYIEYANNLERLMEDAGYDIQEALDAVLAEGHKMAVDPYIILDESCIDRVDIDTLAKVVGADHIFRK